MEKYFRDFIYMDTDRLKSIIAQLNEGLIESITKSSSDAREDKSKAKINVLKFLELGSEHSILFENSDTENHTMHDYLYTIAQEALLENDMLVKIPEDFPVEVLKHPTIENACLSSTSFILIKGNVLVNDFNHMKSILENYNDLLEAVTMGELSNDEEFQKLSPKQKEAKIKSRVKDQDLSKDVKKSIMTYVETFSKEKTILKVFPFEENSNFRFVGNLKRNYLRESIDDIIYKYSTAPSEEWVILAQVAAIPKTKKETVEIEYESNEIEQAFQSIFDGLRGLDKVANSISFPEIAITPIAVFRE